MFASSLGQTHLGSRGLCNGDTLLGNFLKGLASREGRSFAGQRLPAPNGNIDVDRVDFHGASLAAGSFCGNEDCAAATKWVENEVAPFGAIPDCVRNHTR